MDRLHIFVDGVGEDCFGLVGALTKETRKLLRQFTWITSVSGPINGGEGLPSTWKELCPSIPKRRNSKGIDNPDTAAAAIDSSSTNLSHVVAYEKILC